MRCAGWKEQEWLRDLARLASLADELVWLDAEELVEEPGLLVLCGLWLADSGDAAGELLLKRSSAGRATLVVPRFKAGDVGEMLGAPSTLEICPAEFEDVTWEDGSLYGVPGVSTLRTALHAGKWGTATGAGPVVLAYRPHAAAGPIVLCTAAVTGKPPGVSLEEQRRLFQRIQEKTAASCPVSRAGSAHSEDVLAGKVEAQAASVADFLERNGEAGAALLLTLVACGGDRESDLSGRARDLLGIELSEELLRNRLTLLPSATLEEFMEGLRQYGWGAHVRLLLEKMETGGYP